MKGERVPGLEKISTIIILKFGIMLVIKPLLFLFTPLDAFANGS